MTMNAHAKYLQPDVLSRISRLELRACRVVDGFVSGMHKSPYKGFSVEFASHRPYVPGDDIRHIDWRVYAKADRFFIKEYEEETNMRVHILLDCSGSMAYPEQPLPGRMTKWDYAATVAASLTHLLVHQQDGVGLTLFDEAVRTSLPVSSSRGSLHRVVRCIEDHAPKGATELTIPFQQLNSSIPRRGLVVILSDLLTDVDTFAQGLQRFRHHDHDVLVLHILDQDEIEFPFTDRTLFEGMEALDIEILTDPQSLRASYLEAFQAFVSQVRSACLDRGIGYATISTADALDTALTTCLSSRMRSRRARA